MAKDRLTRSLRSPGSLGSLRRSRSALTTLLAFAALALSLAAPKSASAQEGIRLQVNWAGFAEAYRGLTEAASKGPRSDPAQLARVVESDESPWLGSGIVVSLLARDWQGATRLAGGPLAVTDAIRTSRSSRMFVARIGLGGGRIVPYVHLGAGQWRDPNQRVYDAPVEVAGEAGAGLEAKLTRRLSCAFEYDFTTMYRETPDEVAPVDNAFFVVARLEY
jgi:hypothetical protein